MDKEMIEQVFHPFEEVIARTTEDGVEVSVWGRTYQFANAPLPTSITTACSLPVDGEGRGGDEEILASPIRLVGVVDGKRIAWERKGAFLFSCNKAQAIVSGWQANETLIVNTTSQLEFDGMMRVDLVVMPQRGASPKLTELWLEAPLKVERATLFHYWPGRWGSAENSGAIPEAGLTLPFKPFVWLGWEEGGLSWFAESDKGWQPNDVSRYIEVVRQVRRTPNPESLRDFGGEEMVLRLRLLDTQPPESPLPPFTKGGNLPLTFTFGFQATPVKPIPKEFHDWRICHGANYGIENQPVKRVENLPPSGIPPSGTDEVGGETATVLDRMAELGVKTLVFHEHWTPIQNYWETIQEAKLKNLVSECHKRGIKLLLYFGYELSTLAPEWGELADEVLVKNPQGGLAGGYHRQPEQRDYIVCYNSKWQDRLVNGIAQALENYGFDGVYLDGTIEPWGCANERHGCGYRDASGNLKVSYPIFAVRNLMRRLYALIHPKGGLVNAHQSTCCVTPTLAFCHSYWDGEQFGGGELAGDPLQKLPLAAFQAEFMGKNFGVPCEFLVYERPPEWTFEHALAFSLLHDVRVRPGGFGKQLEFMSNIWRAMTDFGVSEAEWYPYWRNQQFVKAQPESVKVSFYLNGNQVLLVVSNLSAGQEVEGLVSLNSSAYVPPLAFTSARDAVTKENLILEEDILRLTLPPMRARLVRIK